MAESIVQITEGSGKKLHSFQRTIGANTVEDEVILLGENYLASYVVWTLAAAVCSTATANSHLWQIMAGASLKVRIRRIEMHQTVAATTGGIMDTRLVRLSTAGTTGTAQTPQPLDPSDTAGATTIIRPTVKGTETSTLGGAAPYMIQTIGASTPFANPIAVWDFDRPRSKPLYIPAGVANGLAITNITAIAGANVSFMVWFDETNF